MSLLLFFVCSIYMNFLLILFNLLYSLLFDYFLFVVFFFFSSRRRHTRSYGDWSSDVCSSDLGVVRALARRARRGSAVAPRPGERQEPPASPPGARIAAGQPRASRTAQARAGGRSEERRVGKECRARWWPAQDKKMAGGEEGAV